MAATQSHGADELSLDEAGTVASVVVVDSWVVVDSLVVDVGRVVVVVGASVVLVEVDVDVLVLVEVEVDDVLVDVVVLVAVVVVVDRASVVVVDPASVVVVDPASVVVVVDGNVGSVGPSSELHAVTSRASTTDPTNAARRRFQSCDRGILGLPAASTKPPPWLTRTPRRRNRSAARGQPDAAGAGQSTMRRTVPPRIHCFSSVESSGSSRR
jgi:hypothetical protein